MQKGSKETEVEDSKIIDSLNALDATEYVNTTLLVHLFGQNGKDVLYFSDFAKYLEIFINFNFIG